MDTDPKAEGVRQGQGRGKEGQVPDGAGTSRKVGGVGVAVPSWPAITIAISMAIAMVGGEEDGNVGCAPAPAAAGEGGRHRHGQDPARHGWLDGVPPQAAGEGGEGFPRPGGGGGGGGGGGSGTAAAAAMRMGGGARGEEEGEPRLRVRVRVRVWIRVGRFRFRFRVARHSPLHRARRRGSSPVRTDTPTPKKTNPSKKIPNQFHSKNIPRNHMNVCMFKACQRARLGSIASQ